MGTFYVRFRRERYNWTVLLHSAAVSVVIWRVIWLSRSWRLNSHSSDTSTRWDSVSSQEDEQLAAVVKKALHGSDDVRIYVYNLPPKFNTLQVAKSHEKPAPIRDPYCDENFYSAEVTIHKALLRSKARTTEAALADFFYVPIYVTCFLINNQPNNLTKSGMFFDEAMAHITHKYAYFNRSQGRDHVYTFTQGFGARLAGPNWRKWRNGIFLTHNGDFWSEEYVPRKDIVIPPDLSHYLTPVFQDGEAHTSNTLSQRRFLAHFGGQALSSSIADHRGSNYSSGVRQYIVRSLQRTPGFRITGTRSSAYVRDMRDSQFCLAPEGWHAWSPRPYYALLLGCVPVVLSERQELAFEPVLPYARLVVWVRPRDVATLNGVLRDVSGAQLLARLRAMHAVWRLFWYGRDGLALDMTLAALARRRYVVRAARDYRGGGGGGGGGTAVRRSRSGNAAAAARR